MRLMDETAGEEALGGTGGLLRGFGCVVDKRIVDARVRGDSVGSGGLEGTFSGSRTLSAVRNLGVGR